MTSLSPCGDGGAWMKVKWVYLSLQSTAVGICPGRVPRALPGFQRDTTLNRMPEQMQIFSLALLQSLQHLHFSIKPTCNLIVEFMLREMFT